MRRAWRWWRSRPFVVRDAVGAVLLAALLIYEAATGGDERSSYLVVAVSALSVLTLVWRRTRPVVPLLATGVAVLLLNVVPGQGQGPVLGALVAVYSAVAFGRRRWGVIAAVVEVVVIAAVVGARGDALILAELALVGALYLIAVVLGLATSARHAVVDAARDRAERAERTREIEASRRVAEERLRIARELHDVIGHHVAVVSVQAAVASRLVVARPQAAVDALEHVQDAAESVLTELGALVRVLREPGDVPPDAPRVGMAVLDELVDEARSAGLDVTASVSGRPRELPPVLDLAAFRIVQESLTNARKHGTGPTRLEVEYRDDVVRLSATNRIDRGPARAGAPSSGFGLVGLQERASAVGGELTTTAEGGRFTLVAVLPVPAPAGGPAAGRDAQQTTPQEDP